MHLSPGRYSENWGSASNSDSSTSPISPIFLSSYVTSNGIREEEQHSQSNPACDVSLARTPRGLGSCRLDLGFLLRSQEISCPPFCPSGYRWANNTKIDGVNGRRFQDLTVEDIESLEELPGSSGRRQSTAYRLDQQHVIKLSPHASLLYEAGVLACIKQSLPCLPVPTVFATRHLHDAAGHDRFCILMEHIDGIRADEAASDWSTEETWAFMVTLQALRATLAAQTAGSIRALDLDDGGGCHVQDELFDHICWDHVDRGPFPTEAEFTEAIEVALRCRGGEAPRLALVSSMIGRLPCSEARLSFPFQHGNLTLGNILVRRTAQASVPEIAGVLGWGQSGFYPPWWEVAKMAASEDGLMVDMVAADATFHQYSQHTSAMLHVRDIIY